MSIQRIRKVNVGEQVFEQLKQMLFSGEWEQGDKLPSENELAGMFGVSRITVRQALQKMNALGLVETRLGEGSFVKKMDLGDTMQALIPTAYLTPNSLEQVMEFREVIDTECARLAARRSNREDIEGLKSVNKKMVQMKEAQDMNGFAKMDAEFHFEIGRITKNALMIKTNHILREVLQTAMVEVIERMGCDPAIKYHALIIEAIELRDERKAVSLMREHLQRNYEYLDIDSNSEGV